MTSQKIKAIASRIITENLDEYQILNSINLTPYANFLQVDELVAVREEMSRLIESYFEKLAQNYEFNESFKEILTNKEY